MLTDNPRVRELLDKPEPTAAEAYELAQLCGVADDFNDELAGFFEWMDGELH